MAKFFFTLSLVLVIISDAFSRSAVTQDSISGVAVIVFLRVDCPISQKYVTKLNAIFDKYKGYKVDWKFIVPQVRVKKKEIKEFVKEYGTHFPVSVDRNRPALSAALGATVTPEVFVLADGILVYSGAIDNWFFELGRYRQQTTENYLIDALEALTRNKQPRVKRTTPIGCHIQ